LSHENDRDIDQLPQLIESEVETLRQEYIKAFGLSRMALLIVS
jgi:hypothetical protein